MDMPSMMHADGFGMASTDGISFWSSFANVLLLVFLNEPSGEARASLQKKVKPYLTKYKQLF